MTKLWFIRNIWLLIWLWIHALFKGLTISTRKHQKWNVEHDIDVKNNKNIAIIEWNIALHKSYKNLKIISNKKDQIVNFFADDYNFPDPTELLQSF